MRALPSPGLLLLICQIMMEVETIKDMAITAISALSMGSVIKLV